MAGDAVMVRVGGRAYRVVASAEEHELHELASELDRRLSSLATAGRSTEQGLLLVALALTHEVDQHRQRAERAEQRAREMLTTLVARIDEVLGVDDDDGANRALHPPL